MAPRELVTRVQLKNYRSIAACDLRPGPLVFLVGPNGSGKSNFLDAFRFVAEALRTSVDHALRRRGGIGQVRRRSTGHPTHFGMRIDLDLGGTPASYVFDIGSAADGGFVINKESCEVGSHSFSRHRESARWSLQGPPPRVLEDRLSLVSISGSPEFRPVFDFLSRVEVYSINPEVIREPQAPDAGDVLLRDGANAASVLSRLALRDAPALERLSEYLRAIVPGVSTVRRKQLGSRETLEFVQEVHGSRHPWHFDAGSMSDGTLRALGVLLALFQGLNDDHASMIGLEEPESALHPAAASALRDALLEASTRRQVLATSHSPELLDSHQITPPHLLSVDASGGRTIITPVDDATRTILRDRLFTPGELLRRGQLDGEPGGSLEPDQLRMFEGHA